jgi:UvrB/uvrC motif
METDWKIGDVAICVDVSRIDLHIKEGNGPQLRLNHRYNVAGVRICKNCGRITLDVGLGMANIITKCGCGELSTEPGIHWCHSIRFRKEYTEEHLNEAVKEENYELASEIRDQLKNK